MTRTRPSPRSRRAELTSTGASLAASSLAAPLGCSSSSGSPNPVTVPDGGSDAPAARSDAAPPTPTDGQRRRERRLGATRRRRSACSTLTNPLYVMSGDTQVPILKALGKALRQDTATPDHAGLVRDRVVHDHRRGLQQHAAQAEPVVHPERSELGSQHRHRPDLHARRRRRAGAAGHPDRLPGELHRRRRHRRPIKAYKGPIQSFVFVVPKASTAQAISAEEAYLTFGFGAAGMVSPWLDPTFYFVRPATKGTQVSMGAMIGVPAAKWKGNPIDQSTAVASMVAASSAPDKTIGILGAEIYDSTSNRAALRSLSFQAYTPDQRLPPRHHGDGVRQAQRARRPLRRLVARVLSDRRRRERRSPTDARAARVVDIFTGAPTATPPAGSGSADAGRGQGAGADLRDERRARRRGRTADDLSVGRSLRLRLRGGGRHRAGQLRGLHRRRQLRQPGRPCRHGYCEAADGRTPLADCATAPASDAAIINNPCTGAHRRAGAAATAAADAERRHAAPAALTTLPRWRALVRRRPALVATLAAWPAAASGDQPVGDADGHGRTASPRSRPRRRRRPPPRVAAAGRRAPVGLHPGRRRAPRRVLAGRGRSVDRRAAQSDALSDPARAPAPRHRPRAHVGQPGAGRQHRQRPGGRRDRRRGHRARAHARRVGTRRGATRPSASCARPGATRSTSAIRIASSSSAAA